METLVAQATEGMEYILSGGFIEHIHIEGDYYVTSREVELIDGVVLRVYDEDVVDIIIHGMVFAALDWNDETRDFFGRIDEFEAIEFLAIMAAYVREY